MEIKAMRETLKEKGYRVPRSNEDVEKSYNKHFTQTYLDEPIVIQKNIYTYVGAGDEPPHMVNFMGRQKFVRGQAVEVADPEVLAKIDKNRCFVRGEVDPEQMFASDKIEKKKADEQRKMDFATNIAAQRANRK